MIIMPVFGIRKGILYKADKLVKKLNLSLKKVI